MKDDTLPVGPEHHHHGMVGGAVLHAIDGALHMLQGWRNRIDPPVEEEEPRRRKPAALQVEDAPAAPAVGAADRHSHVRSTLVFILALVLGAVGGTLLAYRGLARIVEGQESMIDYQREQISLMEKESDRNLAAKARYQKEFYEQEKTVRALREETLEQKERIGELESQLTALKAADRSPPQPRGVPAVQGRNAQVPQKTGTCAMTSGKSAASLANCIDQFNRR